MTEREFAAVREIRMILRDPPGVNDLALADSLPERPDPRVGYHVPDLGGFRRYNERRCEWERLDTGLSDAYVIETVQREGPRRAAVSLLDFIVMGLQAEATGFTAGAQKVARADLNERINLYLEQRKILLERAGLNTGRTFRTRRPAVGGVREAR